MTHEQLILAELAEREQRIVADLAPVDAGDVFAISGYIAGISRGTRRLENVFCVNSQLYADVITVGLEAFDPQQVKTYRWTVEERAVDGCDVETASLREVEWSHGTYHETGDSL
jgi:hypothetical protein